MSKIPNKKKPKPERLDVKPISVERLNDIRMWFISGHPGETSERFGNELLAEVDRLSTTLVDANAEMVTERAAHALSNKAFEASYHAYNNLKAERDKAERKLALAARVLGLSAAAFAGSAEGADINGKHVAAENHRESQKRCEEALAAITSEAPAKADTKPPVYCPPCDTPFTDGDKPHHPGCPASKPLVVGRRAKVRDIPMGATYRFVNDEGNPYATTEVRDGEERDFDLESEALIVRLPSAKADEGKAEGLTNAQRREVREMIKGAFLQWALTKSVTDVAAALRGTR